MSASRVVRMAPPVESPASAARGYGCVGMTGVATKSTRRTFGSRTDSAAWPVVIVVPCLVMRGNAAPGWYPDPAGGPGRKYWDGLAWHDAVPVRPGVPTTGKPQRKISIKALLIAAALLIAVVAVGNVIQSRNEEAKSASSSATKTGATSARVATPVAPMPTPEAHCKDAPSGVVAVIDAAFTDGEHLENTQAIDLPKAMTIIGGNIVNSAGKRVSSQDSWLFSDGAVYALTSDARRRTMLPDGRDLLYFDWATYSYQVGTCVGRATKGR